MNHAVVQSEVPRVSPAAKIRLKPIALPAEHGGWGMLAAPILTGLILAPSWSGTLLALAAIGAFLTRQPLRLALTDLRKGKSYPRTVWAWRFSAFYAVIAALSFAGSVVLAKSSFWQPLALAGILGLIQFSHDLSGKGRSLLPEVCGAAALALLAAGIILSSGAEPRVAWVAALVLALQAATAISYAAARVRLARNVEVARLPIHLAHLVSLAATGALVVANLLSWPVAAAFAVLAGRSLWGLSCHRRNVKASMVGVQEVFYMLLTVACLLASLW